jgi:hypothetical protein
MMATTSASKARVCLPLTLVWLFMFFNIFVSSFAPLSSNQRISSSTRNSRCVLFAQGSSSSDEKILRDKIAFQNEKVDDEEKYAVLDGENLYKAVVVDALQQSQLNEDDKVATLSASSSNMTTTATQAIPASTTATPTSTAETSVTSSLLAMKMQRLIKPRAYPLFLAEKVVEFAETTVSELLHQSSSKRSNSGSSSAVKERIVILGSGWGAASFLKAIDTNVYDVTVISPRVSAILV